MQPEYIAETFKNRKNPVRFVVNEDGCHVCVSHQKTLEGYPRMFWLGKMTPVHRAVYEKIYGNLSKDIVVRHMCDNRSCVNPSHLTTGTHVENVRDRVERGRSAFGERNGRSKISESQAREVYLSKDTNTEISKKYGISRKAVSLIKQKKYGRELFSFCEPRLIQRFWVVQKWVCMVTHGQGRQISELTGKELFFAATANPGTTSYLVRLQDFCNSPYPSRLDWCCSSQHQ